MQRPAYEWQRLPFSLLRMPLSPPGPLVTTQTVYLLSADRPAGAVAIHVLGAFIDDGLDLGWRRRVLAAAVVAWP